MTVAYMLIKKNRLTYTYSENVKNKLIKDKWKLVGKVSGWNLSWKIL